MLLLVKSSGAAAGGAVACDKDSRHRRDDSMTDVREYPRGVCMNDGKDDNT